ncbi:GNAT family N-acetyltransferase [Pseudalkalibacillus hwajinpoensis]|uniref:GNAT family N-acetyltransferase n=1 Tax=Guptibacillus hwajinpoensis TaxID=208199 RepID=A0A4U1MP71_9BACL|nr:GNAT family N-acetyltransferase [Pseudalkalibacillus hwajinpoensis]TKD72521.1 GNAT family N-acetyltransferase [Pseudalkalibacillus hwajinpoensis]
MIRRLTEEDHNECLSLLTPYAAENLFIIGDIEAFGYDQPFQKLWGDFGENGELRAVLLKYEKNYIPYAPGEFNAKGFAEVISQDSEFLMMSGIKRVTSQIQPYISHQSRSSRELFYAKCDSVEALALDDLQKVQTATIDDLEKIHTLHQGIDEFESGETVEEKRRNQEKGVSRTYYIEQDDKPVSAASTAAENSESAMVVGVCTLADYKRKGYATQCTSKLCYDVLSEGKVLCLFYDNPEAGAIYKRIGFRDIEKWMMVSYETQSVIV